MLGYAASEVLRARFSRPIHLIWSLDRKDWVSLGEIEEGEQLLGADGAVAILTHAILQRSVPVYNIEVHGEHVYQVGGLGLLAHNSCIHMHHSIPLAIQKRLMAAGNAAANASSVIGRAGLPNRIPVAEMVHRAIHSGRGYIQNGGIGGGHYNNIFHQLIQRNGGYANISANDVVRIRGILVSWFKL